MHRFAFPGKTLFDKAKSERATKVEVCLVRYGDVQASVLNVFRRLLVDSLAAPVHLAGCSADEGFAVKRGCLARTHPFIG